MTGDFWAKVVKTQGCWLFTGSITHGYGRHQVGRRLRSAHRYAYELAIGPIPEGLVLDHQCHNADPKCVGGPECLHRRCVNPDHLEPVTQRTNVRRGHAARRTHCRHGHEFSEANTAIASDGYQVCRACHRKNQLAYTARKAAKNV